jgi:hypothetical protein
MDYKEGAIQKLLKRLRDGDIEVDDLINKEGASYDQVSKRARNLYEDTLGSEYLRQTGVSVPDLKRANPKQMEKFYNDILAENYPELSGKVGVEYRPLKDSMGEYDPNKKVVRINPEYVTDMNRGTGTALHEFGHAYDDLEVGDFDPIPEESNKASKLKAMKEQGITRGSQLQKLPASDIYQHRNRGHHAILKKLRDAGGFGLGALKGLTNSGTFKSAVPFAGTIAALASGDVEAAIPLIGDSEALGAQKGTEGYDIENPNGSKEDYYERRRKLLQNYPKTEGE